MKLSFLKNKSFWVKLVINLLLVWLLLSLYLTSQSTTLIFNNTISWAPIPNFGYELDFIRNKDNQAIGVWTFPNSSTDEVILYLHGNAGKINVFFDDLQKYGTVVAPAYPGYHESEGKPTPENVYETALLTFDYLVNEKGISPNKITIMGHSLGGSPAVYLASERSSAKQLLIVNTFSSVQSMCWNQYSILCGFTGNILNTAKYAEKVNIPVKQFIYEGDLTVSPEEGKKLYEYFPEGNKEKFILDKNSENTHAYPDIDYIFKKIGF